MKIELVDTIEINTLASTIFEYLSVPEQLEKLNPNTVEVIEHEDKSTDVVKKFTLVEHIPVIWGLTHVKTVSEIEMHLQKDDLKLVEYITNDTGMNIEVTIGIEPMNDSSMTRITHQIVIEGSWIYVKPAYYFTKPVQEAFLTSLKSTMEKQ